MSDAELYLTPMAGLYPWKMTGGLRDFLKANHSSRTNADSHYMTIIGLYKCPGVQPQKYKYILQVVSWRRVYYIDYDQYAKKLNYFSNMLSVY